MTHGPSALYRAELWRLGQWAARVLPGGFSRRTSQSLAMLYFQLNPRRRETVVRNLLPVLEGDRRQARRAARQLFQHFAEKLVDLWQYESGLSINKLVPSWTGWEHFEAARQTGRGILLLTPHLGNWELGAPLLAGRGIKLLVITLDEPDENLTQLRQASRSRWGIETLVIGKDPFAFVEVIRQLEGGAVVALLVDRPPPSSTILIDLFGRPFPASIAPAELARATGCALLPVCIPRLADGYRAEVLAPIVYRRDQLSSRKARQSLTQEILRAFEPMIRQHLSQWYHFVPIWPDDPIP
jgi:lauroyl/myristoyl acyltransferase